MKKIVALFLVISFISCKQSKLQDAYIQFDKPQPENVERITHFSKKYIGTYSLNATSFLIVAPKCIFLEQVQEGAFRRDEFDSIPGYEIRNGKVFDSKKELFLESEIRNDSVFLKQTDRDTLFSFAPDETAKEFKSSLILNKEINGKYVVQYIRFGTVIKHIQLGTRKDATLIQNEIGIKQETEMNGTDTLHVILKPTRADFRKLLRLDGFEFETIYF